MKRTAAHRGGNSALTAEMDDKDSDLVNDRNTASDDASSISLGVDPAPAQSRATTSRARARSVNTKYRSSSYADLADEPTPKRGSQKSSAAMGGRKSLPASSAARSSTGGGGASILAEMEATWAGSEDISLTGDPAAVIPGTELTEAQFSALPANEQKKQRRLVRNRLSAQHHRQRQRAHIDTLEQQVMELSTAVEEMRRVLAAVAAAADGASTSSHSAPSPSSSAAMVVVPPGLLQIVGPSKPGILGFTGTAEETSPAACSALRSLLQRPTPSTAFGRELTALGVLGVSSTTTGAPLPSLREAAPLDPAAAAVEGGLGAAGAAAGATGKPAATRASKQSQGTRGAAAAASAAASTMRQGTEAAEPAPAPEPGAIVGAPPLPQLVTGHPRPRKSAGGGANSASQGGPGARGRRAAIPTFGGAAAAAFQEGEEGDDAQSAATAARGPSSPALPAPVLIPGLLSADGEEGPEDGGGGADGMHIGGLPEIQLSASASACSGTSSADESSSVSSTDRDSPHSPEHHGIQQQRRGPLPSAAAVTAALLGEAQCVSAGFSVELEGLLEFDFPGPAGVRSAAPPLMPGSRRSSFSGEDADTRSSSVMERPSSVEALQQQQQGGGGGSPAAFKRARIMSPASDSSASTLLYGAVCTGGDGLPPVDAALTAATKLGLLPLGGSPPSRPPYSLQRQNSLCPASPALLSGPASSLPHGGLGGHGGLGTGAGAATPSSSSSLAAAAAANSSAMAAMARELLDSRDDVVMTLGDLGARGSGDLLTSSGPGSLSPLLAATPMFQGPAPPSSASGPQHPPSLGGAIPSLSGRQSSFMALLGFGAMAAMMLVSGPSGQQVGTRTAASGARSWAAALGSPFLPLFTGSFGAEGQRGAGARGLDAAPQIPAWATAPEDPSPRVSPDAEAVTAAAGRRLLTLPEEAALGSGSPQSFAEAYRAPLGGAEIEGQGGAVSPGALALSLLRPAEEGELLQAEALLREVLSGVQQTQSILSPRPSTPLLFPRAAQPPRDAESFNITLPFTTTGISLRGAALTVPRAPPSSLNGTAPSAPAPRAPTADRRPGHRSSRAAPQRPPQLQLLDPPQPITVDVTAVVRAGREFGRHLAGLLSPLRAGSSAPRARIPAQQQQQEEDSSTTDRIVSAMLEAQLQELGAGTQGAATQGADAMVTRALQAYASAAQRAYQAARVRRRHETNAHLHSLLYASAGGRGEGGSEGTGHEGGGLEGRVLGAGRAIALPSPGPGRYDGNGPPLFSEEQQQHLLLAASRGAGTDGEPAGSDEPAAQGAPPLSSSEAYDSEGAARGPPPQQQATGPSAAAPSYLLCTDGIGSIALPGGRYYDGSPASTPNFRASAEGPVGGDPDPLWPAFRTPGDGQEAGQRVRVISASALPHRSDSSEAGDLSRAIGAEVMAKLLASEAAAAALGDVPSSSATTLRLAAAPGGEGALPLGGTDGGGGGSGSPHGDSRYMLLLVPASANSSGPHGLAPGEQGVGHNDSTDWLEIGCEIVSVRRVPALSIATTDAGAGGI